MIGARLSQVPGVLWMVLVMCCLGVAVPLYLLTQFNASFEWPTTKGVVIDTWLERYHSSHSDHEYYNVGVEYIYTVDDQLFHKKDKNDITGIIPDYSLEEAQALAAEFPKGEMIDVYYNPESHSTALLKPTKNLIMLIFPSFFGLVLLILLYVIYRFMRVKPKDFWDC
ncbi:hypothetical protein VII00023_08894 [Vibrio ichthyoenteri ATCC 700023]|uniref:DUF3592 domain-containing protein n=1 Tax=Vibrio ichthyoenteri ATCC 700023 TaxID=870968 RepID=F9S578_9VIBR|nr:DUF3592 domain-containing protein [Vibrio ichthyoenteri]EGU35944.1 hypothetical protein VII00023_08894 [Vibrio ichthyoenteri ATCC 700023]